MRSRVLVVLGALTLSLLLPGTVGARSASADSAARAEHDRILAYWTPARIAAARWRDYSVDPKTGKVTPEKGKPGSGGGTGASWTGGGKVAGSVGRILFSSGGSQWICSGTVVSDGSTSNGYSVVLSAGHCAYDGADGWSSNFVFYPDFDKDPTYTCAGRVEGCWTASRLAINSGFYPSGFGPDAALLVDYSFAYFDTAANSGELDAAYAGYGLKVSGNNIGDTTWAFGYPAEGRYKGKDLIYCTGTTIADLNDIGTWGLPCNMNGGSSGGGWLWGASNPATDSGKLLASVNSYSYSGVSDMFGPRFNSQTTSVYNAVVNNGGSGAVVHGA
ncbi:MAG TPA: hypothetical protein VFI15_02420 [Candidatus Limnocylindrales bacterium]|nr:hypothetical protein [Candidatus Limnocylindrales bacterium]